MKREFLTRLAELGVTYDSETDKIQPGLLSPPIRCGAVAQCIAPPYPGNAQDAITGRFLTIDEALAAWRALIEDETRIIIGANIAYDMLVAVVEWARRGVDMLPAVWRAYEQGRVFDVLIADALNAIADGTLGDEKRDPITNETSKYYSLAYSIYQNLGRKDAKVNDQYRTRYWHFRNTPYADWPPAARDYPVDDVRNTHEDALSQVGIIPKVTRHKWQKLTGQGSICSMCGYTLDYNDESWNNCRARVKHRNLHAMADQAMTAFALQLGAAWGFTVNQTTVEAVVREVVEKRARVSVPLIAKGLLKWKKEKGETKLGKDKAKISAQVAKAYGATKTCATCQGTAKVPSPANPKTKINCQECCASGYDLKGTGVRRTDPSDRFPKGQVKSDRDTLYESGDETLRDLAEYDEDAKYITTYGPYLRSAQVEVVGGDGTIIRYPRAITLKPNVLLETDRVSYGDTIGQFPRDGGLRECIEARHAFILVSCDYNQGELVSHSQSCLWIVGRSDLAEVMNRGEDPHSGLAATVLGMTYEEFIPKKKQGIYKDARQASKPWNFGKPGGMGVPKLVMTQRKDGPDTPCPNGPVMIESEEVDADGNPIMVRGYKGLRFCVLMDGAERCGDIQVHRWGKAGYERDIDPSCLACLQCADRLNNNYFAQWSEARPYFKYTGSVVENGQVLTPEQCELFELPLGSSTQPGEMVQHVSNIIRGGVQFNDCSNGYMQSLLAVAAKLAFRRAQRECTDSSILVPIDACQGGVVSAYAGQKSPLYGSRCIVLQHDEIIAELRTSPDGWAQHHAAIRLSEIMERALQEVCPDMTQAVKAPPALMRKWLKGAEPVFTDATGAGCAACSKAGTPVVGHRCRLIPWEPKKKKAA